jgi:3-hydroxyisobutyrate dehydrogenase
VGRCRPLFEALGRTIVHAGPVGAGHALKALNNLLSATHLLASVEAIAVGRRFGLDPQVMIDAINVSTGRSASTERKLPDFVLSERFDSGFALALMLKDVAIAVGLGDQLGVTPALGEQTRRLWAEAARALPADADHTEIARWVDPRGE